MNECACSVCRCMFFQSFSQYFGCFNKSQEITHSHIQSYVNIYFGFCSLILHVNEVKCFYGTNLGDEKFQSFLYTLQFMHKRTHTHQTYAQMMAMRVKMMATTFVRLR